MDTEIQSLVMDTLSKVSRPGMGNLISYLVSSDFFTAPASTKYHGNFAGGLLAHSWDVYKLLLEKTKSFNIGVKEESVAICGLLHDVCKINFYVRGFRNVKENGKWFEKEVWEHKDLLPMGHGEKSVYVIQKYMQLTDEEALAIRWHMGFSEPKDLWWTMNAAMEKYPLATILFTADMEASHILERKVS